uniref:Uncharacterized protein n=2 Tax=Ditylum brightwellii TaxID=49249 RepID=A0A7S4VNE8_9STRA
MQEPKNGAHPAESVSYIVVESGRNILKGGIVVEAGIKSSSTIHRSGENFNGDSVQFVEAFSSIPVILHGLMTHSNNDFMASFVKNIATDSFTVAMEAAGTGTNSNGEDIGWIALSPGSGSTSDARFMIGSANDGESDGVTGKGQSAHIITLTGFNEPPAIVVSINDITDTDGAWARGGGTSDKDVQEVYAEEDKIGDRDQKHNDEKFGWAAFEKNTILDVDTSAAVSAIALPCGDIGEACKDSNDCCGYCTGSGTCA